MSTLRPSPPKNQSGLSATGLEELNINFSQPGLPYCPRYAQFATFYLKDSKGDSSYKLFMELAKLTDQFCRETSYKTVVIRGVSFDLWKKWSEKKTSQLPLGMGNTSVLEELNPPFAKSDGDLWCHIKSDDPAKCQELFQIIEDFLSIVTIKCVATVAAKKEQERVLGGRFVDGVTNPVDPVNLSSRVIVGDEDPEHLGAAYAIAQRFVHNWEKLDDMQETAKEDMIGRKENEVVLPIEDERSHIKCVRQMDKERINFRIMRQAVPYGQRDGNPGHEKGVYFAGYAKETSVFDEVLRGMAGNKKGYIKDKLMNVTHSAEGNFWYIPSAKELELKGQEGEVNVPMVEYFNTRSKNDYMFYNTKDYLKNVNKSKLVEDCPISNRITQLLGLQFSRWRDGWYKKIETPPLGHLKDYVLKEEEYVLDGSAALRKGKAIEISLSRVLISKEYSKRANLYKIHPAEIIVGNMPQLSLGTGSQVMEYLRDDEKISFFFKNLNEYSASGHNVPDYSLLVKLGAGELKSRFEEKLKTATGEKKDYYQSVVWSLNGFSNFVSSYGDLAMEMAKSLPETEKMEIQNLEEISRRMKKIATKKPEGFLESLQLIFIMNCALHQIGESMSIGRLDQWLIDSYNEDISNGLLNKENAQEILDAFWLKMDETVLYNSTHMNDYLNYGSGAVFYSAGNFPQGAAMNQWVQQVTVGGYKANNSATPEAASNDLTVMCLRSARRLPMNAPCLSLRVHKDMDPTLVEEAAKAVLSGGAHPVLLHDDKLIPALKASGPMDLEDARDYTSDGCYEPIIQGKTEWAFSYVPVLPIVGMAMNQGATIMGAGPTHLNGLKEGWNSPVAQDIKNFDEFMDIFFTQWRWAMNKFYNSLMNGYGDLWNVCPSPLFSSMVHDTLETGKDMTNGGARYHIIAPMMCGMANTIDSLHSINKMVFDKDSCITTLPELLQTLRCNWGQNMIEPWNSSIAGDMRAEDKSLRYKSLRDFSLSLNKFGQGNDPEIVALAERVVQGCVDIIHDSLDNAIPPIKDAYEKIKEKYKLPNRDFAFTVTPGVGTFEDNVGLGEGMGASADGRTMGTPIAEDFAPAPSPQDLPIDNKPRNIFKALKDWNIEAINLGISNAAPVDVNIHEEFPLEDLSKVITQFANSEIGSNMMTITCGDTSTFEKAAQFPERYDLVRVRMGGWSEFFVAMFSNHQQHIMRRPFFVHQDCPHKHQ